MKYLHNGAGGILGLREAYESCMSPKELTLTHFKIIFFCFKIKAVIPLFELKKKSIAVSKALGRLEKILHILAR